MAGKKISDADAARLGRMLRDYESRAAQVPAPTEQPRAPTLSLWMLNAPFAPLSDDEAPFNPENAYGRRFAAEAIAFEPTRLRCQTLRLKNLDYGEPEPFRLTFRGTDTEELTDDLTAAELLDALVAMDDLAGLVGVIGHQSPIGTTTYAARQWHILYAEALDGNELLTLSEPGNLRLFRDWWRPARPALVGQVWTGLPNDARLEPGAFGYCYPFDVAGLTWLHGECYAKSES